MDTPEVFIYSIPRRSGATPHRPLKLIHRMQGVAIRYRYDIRLCKYVSILTRSVQGNYRIKNISSHAPWPSSSGGDDYSGGESDAGNSPSPAAFQPTGFPPIPCAEVGAPLAITRPIDREESVVAIEPKTKTHCPKGAAYRYAIRRNRRHRT